MLFVKRKDLTPTPLTPTPLSDVRELCSTFFLKFPNVISMSFPSLFYCLSRPAVKVFWIIFATEASRYRANEDNWIADHRKHCSVLNISKKSSQGSPVSDNVNGEERWSFLHCTQDSRPASWRVIPYPPHEFQAESFPASVRHFIPYRTLVSN